MSSSSSTTTRRQSLLDFNAPNAAMLCKLCRRRRCRRCSRNSSSSPRVAFTRTDTGHKCEPRFDNRQRCRLRHSGEQANKRELLVSYFAAHHLARTSHCAGAQGVIAQHRESFARARARPRIYRLIPQRTRRSLSMIAAATQSQWIGRTWSALLEVVGAWAS